MKTWQDQKIGTRLGVVFGIILLCVIAAGAFRTELAWPPEFQHVGLDAEAL